MLKRTPDFTHHVWEAADRIGRSAPRIVDHILRSVFPNTTDAAETEGAARILRNGCIAEVKRVLHHSRNRTGQSDFGEVDASFLPLIRSLQRPSYFVPERDEEVSVRELIADPAQLDAARRFMRLKGMQCLDEADRLDRLYEAVIRAAGDDPNQYVDIAIKVPERKYTAWPENIRTAFAPARTVKTGKPSFVLTLKEDAR